MGWLGSSISVARLGTSLSLFSVGSAAKATLKANAISSTGHSSSAPKRRARVFIIERMRFFMPLFPP